jgi:hypothetical protein
MAKLNQIVAVEKGIKTSTFQKITDAHQKLQKSALLSGISRTYRPKDEDGELLPAESTKVQLNAADVLKETTEALTELFDITATKDFTNCEAKADVNVNGTILLKGVPATYLLFLEKELVNIRTYINKIPTLDQANEWEFRDDINVYSTPAVETARTKKIPRNHVKAEATDKHPAQVDVYLEDVVVGYWTKYEFSGAIPATRQKELLGRVEELQKAVKFAREQANLTEVTRQEIGKKVFDWLLA